MRKIGLSLVLVGILGATNAVAEESGVFVGVQAGYGGANAKMEISPAGYVDNQKVNGMSGFRYGLVAGYKQFFTPEFGARYYAMVDLGTDYSKEQTEKDKDENGDEIEVKRKAKINTYNITANADALYNFLSNDALDFGAFAGLSLGYVNHKFKAEETLDNIKPSGFDLGINFGFRANIAANHGVELYSRFGILQQKKELKGEDAGSIVKVTYKVQQPYQIGLRYTFSF